MKKFCLFLLIFMFIFTPMHSSAKTKINKNKVYLCVGGNNQKLKITGTKRKVKWSTSNKKIKIVKKTKNTATIKAVSKGKSVLIGKIGKKKYKCNVVVQKPRLNRSYIKIREGQNFDLIFVDEKGDYISTDYSYKCFSSDDSIASVSEYGEITALNPGKCVITIKYKGIEYKCNVEVIPPYDMIKAQKEIRYEAQKTPDRLLLEIKNSYIFDSKCEIELYLKKNGKNIYKTEYFCIVGANSDSFVAIDTTDDDCNPIYYDDYYINISASDTIEDYVVYSNYFKNLSCYTSSNAVCCKIKNTCDKDDIYVSVTFILYKDGKVIKAQTTGDYVKYNKTQILSCDFPWDDNYDDIIPDNVEVKLSEAYK